MLVDKTLVVLEGETVADFVETQNNHQSLPRRRMGRKKRRASYPQHIVTTNTNFSLIADYSWNRWKHDRNSEMVRYLSRRYMLFSRYDEGILLDDESWYSVTPEEIAIDTAKRYVNVLGKGAVVLDMFLGAGGNAIQFARFGLQVIAIDNDPQKVAISKHNAAIYGVEKKIEFIVADSVELTNAISKRHSISAVFASPPWGGPGYHRGARQFRISEMKPFSASQVFQAASKVSPNIALFLPRFSCPDDIQALAEESKSTASGNLFELERNYVVEKNMYRQETAITLYFGHLATSETTQL